MCTIDTLHGHVDGELCSSESMCERVGGRVALSGHVEMPCAVWCSYVNIVRYCLFNVVTENVGYLLVFLDQCAFLADSL